MDTRGSGQPFACSLSRMKGHHDFLNAPLMSRNSPSKYLLLHHNWLPAASAQYPQCSLTSGRDEPAPEVLAYSLHFQGVPQQKPCNRPPKINASSRQ
ncbi:unnamed protein product [Nesidiocoris tenuis]|uniref:Uncharacterized protein n=1 Tax=Nesidiocoris tenuis TaxID=355587 RepID=A0A6H5HG75_9HEMI|nr:unnamed protein product [Nesidiocoris tenuis]